ncbi:MAG: TIGR04376 family protein [Synechococcaceae cyanobacterium SM2_3_1]|nr:TIGR04376 family protein [Synechococcaceae cyanobacterium SM2_3_1]
MGLFEDVSRFLETRLEEFLKAHPDLELQALDEQLRQQEADAVRLLAEARAEEKRLQASILSVAEDVKTWHFRVEKATKANRSDLAQGARDREAAFLSQGNQLWGHMKGVQERIRQMEMLLRQVQQKRQEIKQALEEVRQRAAAEKAGGFPGWSGWTKPADPWDDLERKFHELEVDEELARIRQQKR